VSRELADLQELAAGQELEATRQTRPKNAQERAERRVRIERLLDTSGLQESLETFAATAADGWQKS
jgi:hypothetical protein